MFVEARDDAAALRPAPARARLGAGVIVGIVALPLAIAFTSRAASPRRGLWTAIVAGFLVSALGGSRAIGGPTGAFVVIVGIVQKYGIDG